VALPTAQKIARLSYFYLSEIVEGSQFHQGSFFLGGLSRVPLSLFLNLSCLWVKISLRLTIFWRTTRTSKVMLIRFL